MLVIPLDHAEKVVGGGLLVAEDERPHPPSVAGEPVEPRADIGRDALLAPLENEDPHPPRAPLLLLDPPMQMELCGIERERHEAEARVLPANAQRPRGIMRKIIPQPLADRPLACGDGHGGSLLWSGERASRPSGAVRACACPASGQAAMGVCGASATTRESCAGPCGTAFGTVSGCAKEILQIRLTRLAVLRKFGLVALATVSAAAAAHAADIAPVVVPPPVVVVPAAAPAGLVTAGYVGAWAATASGRPTKGDDDPSSHLAYGANAAISIPFAGSLSISSRRATSTTAIPASMPRWAPWSPAAISASAIRIASSSAPSPRRPGRCRRC